MTRLRELRESDLEAFSGTTYEGMTPEERREMLAASESRSFRGQYFEMFAVERDGVTVGFMNLYAHSEHVIGIGPDTREGFRRRGLAAEGMTLALARAKDMGYTVVSNSVRADNEASVALHRKLGFELDREYTNGKGARMLLFLRAL